MRFGPFHGTHILYLETTLQSHHGNIYTADYYVNQPVFVQLADTRVHQEHSPVQLVVVPGLDSSPRPHG